MRHGHWHAHGPWFDFGPLRWFGKGDMKYLVLSSLVDRPKHGYEIIKEIERKCGGFHSPSPGAVYPTLQMLEDLGYVKSTEQEGKKVYEITEEGRAFLKDKEQAAEEARSRAWGWCGVGELAYDLRALGKDFADLSFIIAYAAKTARKDPDRLSRIREVIERARREVYHILGEEPGAQKP